MEQVVGIRFKDEELKEIDKEAENQMRSRTNLLKTIIKKFLEENGRTKK